MSEKKKMRGRDATRTIVREDLEQMDATIAAVRSAISAVGRAGVPGEGTRQ